MSYPERLLPNYNYKIISVDDLSANHYFIRHTDNADVWDSLDKLKIDFIDSFKGKEIFGLSCNLYGIFTDTDVMFKMLDRKFREYWNEGDNIIEIQESDFSIEGERSYFFLRKEHIHNKSFPCNRPINRKKVITFSSISSVVHKPTLCNFWHFELHFVDDEGNNIRSKKSGWIDTFGKALLRSIIKKYAVKTLPRDSCIYIQEKIYIAK